MVSTADVQMSIPYFVTLGANSDNEPSLAATKVLPTIESTAYALLQMAACWVGA